MKNKDLRANKETVLEYMNKDADALQYACQKTIDSSQKITISWNCWQVPSPSNVLSGYMAGRPSEEEIRKLEEDALKRRLEWKPNQQAMKLFEDLNVFIGHRVHIQFWDSMMSMLDEETPLPLEADCKDVVILNVDMRGDVFPQAYLLIDNIGESKSSLHYLTRRERITDPLADHVTGQFASLARIYEIWKI